ncbi:hypothetical protein L228DRAFT_268022 [Xylona heveae TC161]|uniref:Uncharacterized protein n=1 Tax=Xylona heveae (strain CBS 132557 / TC161) TaxID=1328760 RepID=A0A165GV38_XYLHT|nr:hypothetical protein L228DRAFT_268022 [Xylona heveae TC161]KZF22633.1 hypothetical protein L228DRAFT_268022 [Xylona heveae TC161]
MPLDGAHSTNGVQDRRGGRAEPRRSVRLGASDSMTEVLPVREEAEWVSAQKHTIEEQLRTGSAILVLQSNYTDRSHCRAVVCPPRQVTGWPNISSAFRLKLMHSRTNEYFHVSCMERMLDLTTLIEPGYFKMEGGVSLVGILGHTLKTQRFHEAIEDWFGYGGRTFDPSAYSAYRKAHRKWEGDVGTQSIRISSLVTATIAFAHLGQESPQSTNFSRKSA